MNEASTEISIGQWCSLRASGNAGLDARNARRASGQRSIFAWAGMKTEIADFKGREKERKGFNAEGTEKTEIAEKTEVTEKKERAGGGSGRGGIVRRGGRGEGA